jgi:hypothetical protein
MRILPNDSGNSVGNYFCGMMYPWPAQFVPAESPS